MSPYIEFERRPDLELYGLSAKNAGELNYQITRLICRFVAEHKIQYETLNAVVGVLDSVKVEFQRRVVAPYEDTKRIKNGDVYKDLLEGAE